MSNILPFGLAVARGAAYLDETKDGWRDTILDKAKELQMDNPRSCVLGHVFGEYFEALQDVKKTEKWAVAHGFNVPKEYVKEDYSLLSELWIAEAQHELKFIIEARLVNALLGAM